MAGFTFTPGNGDGKFHIRRQSFLTDGVEFSIVSAEVGTWSDENGKTLNKDGGNSIRFRTSLSDAKDDTLNINLFISRRRVVYDKHGDAKLVPMCEFASDFVRFIETEIGREESDPSTLKGTAKQVADTCVEKFFKGKTLVAKELKDIFFKSIENGVEHLNAPIDPVIVIGLK